MISLIISFVALIMGIVAVVRKCMYVSSANFIKSVQTPSLQIVSKYFLE